MIEYPSEIQKQFNEVIAYSQKIENPKTDDLFSEWARNKEYFYHAFGDKLIYDAGVVDIRIDNSQFPKLFDQFFKGLCDKLCEHKCPQDEKTLICDFFHTLSIEEFFENYIRDCSNVLSKFSKVKAGMKIGTALKTFITNSEILRIINDYVSVYIQKKAGVKGHLYFSIHPLDFLSLSENAHKWRSCHALDGEFRSGNLSYMGDPSTIICYIANEKQYKLPQFPESVNWNSKKIRTLIHFNTLHTHYYINKQYPYTCENNMNFIYTINGVMTTKLFQNIPYSMTHEGINYISTTEGRCYDNYDYINKLYMINECAVYSLDVEYLGLGYNDLDDDAFYPIIVGDRHTLIRDYIKWKIGRRTFCLNCGGSIITSNCYTLCDRCIIERLGKKMEQTKSC